MFTSYKVEPFFDEMLKASGKPKDHYQKFYDMIQKFSIDELKENHETAQLSFLRQGITFTVYNNNVGAEGRCLSISYQSSFHQRIGIR